MPSCNCEIHNAKPPIDVWLRQGCDQWEHEIGRPVVMWRSDDADGNVKLKPAPKAIDPLSIDDDSIPF